MAARLLVGISSWADPTLLASGFYPKKVRADPAARLAYYAERFPLVENDAPYYALPTAKLCRTWSERTPPGFTMNVKAFALLTQHHTDPRRFPADVREALPPAVLSKRRVYPSDLDPILLAEIALRFRDALEPLRASGRLGLVLFQYPVWVPFGREPMKLIASLRDLLPADRVAIEFRNATWMSPGNEDTTLAFLRDKGLVYTCVDEPQGFPSSVPPVTAATSEVALVRFHGHNAERWNANVESARERFDYRYTEPELRAWAARIRELGEQAREVHVVMNNCYSDHAVTNAATLQALLATEAAERAA